MWDNGLTLDPMTFVGHQEDDDYFIPFASLLLPSSWKEVIILVSMMDKDSNKYSCSQPGIRYRYLVPMERVSVRGIVPGTHLVPLYYHWKKMDTKCQPSEMYLVLDLPAAAKVGSDD